MLTLIAIVALQASSANRVWYGPATVTFPFQFAGNPYDIEKSDVRVRFTGSKGQVEERLAFYDQEAGGFVSVLLAEEPGKYKATLIRNGQVLDAVGDPELVDVGAAPTKRGFVRVDALNPGKFCLDDGTPYAPLGFNLAWLSNGLPDFTAMLSTMGQNGINWTRIMASAQDGKNPWVDSGFKGTDDLMLDQAFKRWDDIMAASEKAGVAFQFVLFDRSFLNDWQNHAWNKSNSGFMDAPADFFSNAEARRRTKMWLRCAVSRWGHSPAVMAWELFDGAQSVEGMQAADVTAWHREMEEYIRSIDPYRHPIAGAIVSAVPDLHKGADFYHARIPAADALNGFEEILKEAAKPFLVSSLELPAKGDMPARQLVRDGLWAGILAGHSGAASIWDWELIQRDNLYSEFKVASEILKASGYAKHFGARPHAVRLSSESVTTSGNAEPLPALRQLDWLMAKVAGSARSVHLSALGLAPGKYEVLVFDLDSGKQLTKTTNVSDVNHQEPLDLKADSIVVFRKID